MDWELIGHIAGVIMPIILGHLGIKGYQHKKQKANGGTVYDKLHNIEKNGAVRAEKIKNIENDIKEIRKDIKYLTNERRK